MRKDRLKSAFGRLLVFLGTGLMSVWLFQTTTHREIQQSAPPTPISTPHPVVSEAEEPQQLLDIWIDDDSLLHHGYEVRRLQEIVSWDYPDEHGTLVPKSTEASYAVVKRNGRTLARFDGPLHPAGNQVDFGLFDLLRQKSEELIISVTIPRGGRHWVVSLQPTFRILFDSREFGVGREEFYVVDIDKDGVSEICLYLTSFYGMKGLNSVSETPLPRIYFKYDSKLRKYLPANHLFPEYALRHLNREPEKEIYEHHRFSVLLDYVYAGKETQGWASFDQHYPSTDKEVMRARIKAVLKDDPLYRYLYRQKR